MPHNRAILLTPPGAAAIAVVRLTGPATRDFLKHRFSAPLHPSRPIHGLLRDENGNEIDDPVIVLSPDGSFADLNLHGGPWVVRALLETARRAGFETIERTEFPLPDEAIDATSVIAGEIAAYLPRATTELALRTLLAQERVWENLQPRADEIDAILNDRSLHWLLHPPRIAIVGAPNVGKSTLANQLFAQERSITADLPGTTRDWVGETANLDGLAVQLVDTPGIRETPDEIEREAIRRSGAQIQQADLVIFVLDASRPFEPGQTALLGRFPGATMVINKIDAPHAWDLASIDGIKTVAKDGTGVDLLMRAVRTHFGCEAIDPARPRCWTERQRQYLQQQR